MNAFHRQSKSSRFLKFFIIAIGIAIAASGCKRENLPSNDVPKSETVEPKTTVSPENGDADKSNDAPAAEQIAADDENAADPSDSDDAPPDPIPDDVVQRLLKAKILRDGLAIVSGEPQSLEANPKYGIDKTTKCQFYRIGDNFDTHFSTHEMVYYCPELDKIFRYDIVNDSYAEVVSP